MENTKFKVPVVYSFSGEFFISAPSQAMAEKYAEKHCGLTLGPVHSTLPEGDVDWSFSSHPAKIVGRAALVK